MVRNNNRQVTRLFFVLVLAMAFLGGRYAMNHWLPDFGALVVPELSQESDWIEFFSALGEQVLQLFLGLTSE